MQYKLQLFSLFFIVHISVEEIYGQINHVKKSIRQENYIQYPDIERINMKEEIFEYENFLLKNSTFIETNYKMDDTIKSVKQKYTKINNYNGCFISKQIVKYPLTIFSCEADFYQDSTYKSFHFSIKNNDSPSFTTSKIQTLTFDSFGDLILMENYTPLNIFSEYQTKTVTKPEKTFNANRKYIHETYVGNKKTTSSTTYQNIYIDHEKEKLNFEVIEDFADESLNNEISNFQFNLNGSIESIHVFDDIDSKKQLQKSFEFDSDSSNRIIKINEINTFEEREINFEYNKNENAYSNNICLNENKEIMLIDWSLDMNIDTKVLLIDKKNLKLVYYNVYPLGKPFIKHLNLPKGEYFVILLCKNYFGFEFGSMINFKK